MKSNDRLEKIAIFLEQMLPMVRAEATKGRWPDVLPQHFQLIKEENQSYLALRYSDGTIYDMIFKVGAQKGGFDPEVTGEWVECIYEFRCFSHDHEVKAYYTEEQKQLYRLAATILDWISYKALFFYSDEENSFSIVVKRDWAFIKFCLMLDVFLPLKNQHEAKETLITKSMLAQKERMEKLFGTQMEIVDEPDYLFTHGSFIKSETNNDLSKSDDCPF